MAWRQEGSEVECLVEIEGERPVLTIVRRWGEWMELERTQKALMLMNVQLHHVVSDITGMTGMTLPELPEET
jgi:hypothetical protein